MPASNRFVSNRKGRDFIARHGETVFNIARRMQGDHPHTPLTRAGFAQADAMGAALRELLGAKPKLTLWSSSAGRALQTLAIIAEHLELDWHQARTDRRLAEIDVGGWGGRYYRDVAAEMGNLVDPHTGLLATPPPDGESYADVAGRLRPWLAEVGEPEVDRLVVMHGISSRVLRAMLTPCKLRTPCGVDIAEGVPQGRLVEIADAVETML